MKILEEAMKKNRRFKLKNERGSVTLFVLIAMLFFLIVGLIIFMANMNNSTSQQRDVKKIQSEYNVKTSELDEIYNEQEKKQTGKLLISVTDNFGEIYEDGKWIIKEETASDNQMPLSVEITWPEGIKNSEKKIKIEGTINGEEINITIDSSGITGTAPANIRNLIETKDNVLELKSGVEDCDVTVTATVNNKTSEVNVKVDRVLPTATITPNEDELWIDKDKGETTATINATINATDTNGSGIKEVYYQWNDSADSVDDSNWIKGDGANFDIENPVPEGTYYLHVKIIDEAGNVKEINSKPYVVREANYRIETQGQDDQYAMTLVDALKKSTDNRSKIVVIQNCYDGSEPTIDKNITIDTNGYTDTMDNTITVASGKTATFVDNKTEGRKGKLERVVAEGELGDLITNSGTVKVGTNANDGPNLESKDITIHNGTVEVKSGTVTSLGKNTLDGASGIYADNVTVSGGTINAKTFCGIVACVTGNITGGTIISDTHGICPTGGILNISGNARITAGRIGIAHAGEGHIGTRINISGGEISGNVSAISLYADNATVTITGGTLTGGTETDGDSAIKISGKNSILTIGDETNELSKTTPQIEGINGYGVNITEATTQFNFYSGKIIGTQTTNVRGVNVAFSVADASKVKYRTEYGAHTDTVGSKYETTLEKPVWNANTETIYLNTTDNDEEEIEITGTDIGTITYTSEDEDIAEVEEDDNDNKKATVTAKDDGETKIIVKDENSETTKEITVIIDSIKPTITATPASTAVTKSINVTITAEDRGQSGLANDNSYQYAIVDSNTVAPTEGWKNYTSGTAFAIGEGETRTCYIWVKEVKDRANNKSTENGTKVETYHVFGPYIFDNSKPKVTITPNGNETYAKSQSATVTVEDIGAAGINTSSLKYQWTQSEETPAENTFTESYTSGQTLTKDGVTGDNWYLWILAEDNVGNKITIHSDPFYIDNTPPTYTEPRIENVTPTGYDVIVTGVSDENAGMGTVKIIAWTTEGGQDDIKEFEAEKQADGTTWKYHVEVTDHNNEYGPYNTTVKIEDKLGNEVVKTMTETDVPGVTMTFDSNEGTEAQPKTIKKGYDAVIGTLPTTSRVGYTFKGWWTAKTNGDQITESSKTPATDTTYYAHWEAITYTIKYNENGSTSGSTADSIHTYNEEKEITENGYKREYTVTYNYNYSGSTNTSTKVTYDFVKWTRNQDGTGDSYTNKQKVLNLSSTNGDVLNFYAQWNSNSTTLPTPTRNDYQFFGWYTDENCTTKVDDGGATYTPTRDITLYAKWDTANYSTRTTTGTYYFKEFASAVNKADNTGSVITILQDHTDSSDKTVNKTVEINTNGKTATYTNSILVGNGKTVTFTGNGKIQRTDGGLITNSGTVTVNGATLESTAIVINGGTVNVSAGMVNNTDAETSDSAIAISASSVTVSGGTVSCSAKHSIISSTAMTITGGTITSKSGIAPLSGALTISGNPTISGTNQAIYVGSTQSPTITISGGTITGETRGIYVENTRTNNANITITGGTITGETNGISVTGNNTTITIGETSKTPASNTPVITGTTGYGINITQTSSTLNFYSGKIVGKTKATTRGVDTAFSAADQSKVNYPANYGAHTENNSGMYETTLAIPVLNVSPEVIYLNLNNNTTGQITATGSDYGTLTYSSNNETVARVSDTGMIEAKAVGEAIITVTEASTGKTTTCRVVVDATLPIWTITLRQII